MIKKVIVLTILLMLISLGTVFSYSEDISPPPGEKVNNGYAKDEVVFEKDEIRPASADLISRARSTIRDIGNGRVEITGLTETFYSVEVVSAEIILQTWNGSSWDDIISSVYSEENHWRVNGSQIEDVQPGYYRVVVEHEAHNGSQRQTINTETSYIEI